MKLVCTCNIAIIGPELWVEVLYPAIIKVICMSVELQPREKEEFHLRKGEVLRRSVTSQWDPLPLLCAYDEGLKPTSKGNHASQIHGKEFSEILSQIATFVDLLMTSINRLNPVV